MIKKSRLELAVGIFMIVGLGILVLFVFFIRDFQIIKPGYKFDVSFGFANGIKIGAPARLAGVDVGEVKNITIFYDLDARKTRIKILVWVREDIQIPADSKAWINTLGLLGEKYLEIFPGENYALLVKANDTLPGQDPVPLEEITEQAKKIVLKFDATLGSLNEVLGKIKTGEGTIGRFIYTDVVYKNLEEMTEDLKRHPWKLFWKPKDKPIKK